MFCRKCNTELPEDSLFCNKCGSKTTPSALKDVGNKKKWILISSIVVVVIILGVTISLLNSSPVGAFEKAISNNKYGDANQIFEKEIKGDLKKEMEVEAFLQVEIDSILQEHATEKIDYNSATVKLETIQKTELLKSKVSEAFSTINALNDSRTAFKTGQELLKNNNIKDALIEFRKVSDTDTQNYTKSQELIKDISSDYKSSVLTETEKLASEQNYVEAINIINHALAILNSDSDLTSKKVIYEKQNEEKIAAERKNKMEELKEKQEVSVVSAKVVRTGNYIDFYHVEVVVKNNTNKVVKDFTAKWFAYDSNGYPIKLDSKDYLDGGSATAVNIQPGKNFGNDYGWSILNNGDKAKSIIAVVEEVEYYDGTKWENEYYGYWVEELKGKPLK